MDKDIIDKMLDELMDNKIVIDKDAMTVKDLPDYSGWEIKKVYYVIDYTDHDPWRNCYRNANKIKGRVIDYKSPLRTISRIEIHSLKPTPKRIFISLKNWLLKRRIHSCHTARSHIYSIPSYSRIPVFRGILGAGTFLMDLSGKKITPSFHNIHIIGENGVLVGCGGRSSYFINRHTGKEMEIKEMIDRPDGIDSVYKRFGLSDILDMYDENLGYDEKPNGNCL